MSKAKKRRHKWVGTGAGVSECMVCHLPRRQVHVPGLGDKSFIRLEVRIGGEWKNLQTLPPCSSKERRT
jgi:hypothetical protein